MGAALVVVVLVVVKEGNMPKALSLYVAHRADVPPLYRGVGNSVITVEPQ